MTDDPPPDDAAQQPATQPLVSSSMGDRCVTCGRPLSSDQRYCVACGERRGKARFALPAASPATTEPVPRAPSAPSRSPRASSGTTVVAGVGTLLLAMGVGVLIGRNSADNVNAKPVQAAAPTVVTVGGGAGTATTAGSAGTVKSTKKGAKSKHNGKAKGDGQGLQAHRGSGRQGVRCCRQGPGVQQEPAAGDRHRRPERSRAGLQQGR